jgi:predicted metalloprotease with PDZ domain
MPCNDGYIYTAPAAHYAPNAFGLYDMFGNARQWTADCWHTSYAGAPADGTAWTSPGPCAHVIRGGAWNTIMRELRSASRYAGQSVDNTYGFRVARTLAAEAGGRSGDDARTSGGAAPAGAPPHGWTGLRIQTVTPKLMDVLGVREARGAAVVEAQPDSPAAYAGLESGDVIIGVNGRDISDAPDLARTISALSPGAIARLSVIRKGQGRTVSMTVGSLAEQR